MNYNELKIIFDRIEGKVKESERLIKIKLLVDERTDQGLVDIKFEGQEIKVNPTQFKQLIDTNVAQQDTTADFAELKTKAK